MSTETQRSPDSLHSINAVVSLGDTNDNKAWDKADKIEVVLNLELEGETKTFRGLIDLSE